MAFTFTDENVNEIIESGKPVVIDFWATWCGPCMALAPVIDELAEQYEGQVVIGKYNVEDESDFSSDHRIRMQYSKRSSRYSHLLLAPPFHP